MLNINLMIRNFGSVQYLPFSRGKMRAEELIWLTAAPWGTPGPCKGTRCPSDPWLLESGTRKISCPYCKGHGLFYELTSQVNKPMELGGVLPLSVTEEIFGFLVTCWGRIPHVGTLLLSPNYTFIPPPHTLNPKYTELKSNTTRQTYLLLLLSQMTWEEWLKTY